MPLLAWCKRPLRVISGNALLEQIDSACRPQADTVVAQGYHPTDLRQRYPWNAKALGDFGHLWVRLVAAVRLVRVFDPSKCAEQKTRTPDVQRVGARPLAGAIFSVAQLHLQADRSKVRGTYLILTIPTPLTSC